MTSENKRAFLNRFATKKEDFEKLLSSKSQEDNINGIRSIHVTPDHITKALNSDSPELQLAAIENSNADKHNIEHALKSSWSDIQTAAIYHKNVDKDNAYSALRNKRLDRLYARDLIIKITGLNNLLFK